MSRQSSPAMTAFEVHHEVAGLLREAREAYVAGNYRRAESLDAAAKERAGSLGCVAGVVRAQRLLGLCSYRLGEAQTSVARLEEALAAAERLDWVAEGLLVRNHLGASLRKTGDLERAHEVLHRGLEAARGREFLAIRARLLGSMGALLDDLGDLDAAADHYARYQELLWLTDDAARQANAAGLVGRVQRLRGNHGAALASARDERRLGRVAGVAVREARGALHEAQALVGLGQHDEAEQALDLAERLIREKGDPRNLVRLLGARAEAARARGDLLTADRFCTSAWRDLADAGLGREAETRARQAEMSAQVSSALGLHGEALWHLGVALEGHLERYGSIKSEGVASLTRHRRAQLRTLATALLDEEGSVERSTAEHARVLELVQRLDSVAGASSSVERGTRNLADWRSEIRSESSKRWGRVFGDDVERLHSETRADLVLVDVLAHGPVGDLARSLFLLFSSLEREFFLRVFDPLRGIGPERLRVKAKKSREVLKARNPPSLGQMCEFVEEESPALIGSRPDIGRHWESIVDAGRALSAAPMCLDGVEGRPPRKLRNAIAHGRGTALERLEADAIRRAVILREDSLFQVLAKMPVVYSQ